MPVPAVLNQIAAYMAKIEAVYGTAETLTPASDGVYPYIGDGLPEPAEAPTYLYDGDLGRNVGSLLPARRTGPVGRGRKADFPAHFKGAGTTYTAGVLPPREVDLMLRAAGFDRTFSSATHTYTPTPAGTGYASLTVGQYVHDKEHIMRGALADWSFEFGDLGVPVHTFALQGIGDTVLGYVPLPSVTYQYGSIIPPVASAAVVTIGSWTAPVVKGGSFKLGRDLSAARARITDAQGHMGHVPKNMVPELTLMVEQTELVGSPYHTSGGIHPELLQETAAPITVSVRIGSTTFNRYTVTLNNAQLVAQKPVNDDAIAMYELTFRGSGTTAVSVLFD